MRPPSTKSAQYFARDLRTSATDAEKLLWQELRRGKVVGARFRRQVPIGPYVADFACLRNKLIIELDGSQHIDRASYDDARSSYLKSQKFRVLRFWNGDVFNQRQSVVETIVWAIAHPAWRQERDPLPRPPPTGEGEEN